jgi:hypothetical protein
MAICLAAGLMVAMAFGTGSLVWQPRTAYLLSAEVRSDAG